MIKTILMLAVFPAVVKFPWNWVAFWWGFRHGAAPMPPEVKARERKVGRYLSFPVSALLVALVAYLAGKGGISPQSLGLHLRGWQWSLLVGIFTGTILPSLPLALLPFLGRSRMPRIVTEEFLEGTVAFWLLQIPSVDFAEELWRAASLCTLNAAGTPSFWSVSGSSLVFGIGHLGRGVPRALGSATFGAAAAVLFLWSQSLLAPYAFHVTVTLCTLYRSRRHPPSRNISSPPTAPWTSRSASDR